MADEIIQNHENPEEDLNEKIYRIPESNLEKLQRKIDQLSKRSIKLGLPPVTIETVNEEFELWVRRDPLDPDSRPWQVGLLDGETIADAQIRVEREKNRMLRFEVLRWMNIRVHGGRPIINGWRFACTIEFTEAGNILRTVPGFPDEALPPQYRHTGSHCEHCNSARQRTNVFVLEKVEDGEFKQVGRSCLKDFLGHSDPHFVAEMSQILSQLVEVYGNPDDEFWGEGRGERYYYLLRVLIIAAAVVRVVGFTSRKNAQTYGTTATSETVFDIMNPPKYPDSKWNRWREQFDEIPADREIAEKSLEWAQNIPENTPNDYLWNLRVVAHLEALRGKQLGIAVSMIASYRREFERTLQRERQAKRHQASEFVGEEGKMIETVAVLEGLQTWEGSYGVTVFHRFIDDQGNVLVWKASRDFGFQQGHRYEIRGKVKSHENYRGKNSTIEVKQTNLILVKMKKDLGTTEPQDNTIIEG